MEDEGAGWPARMANVRVGAPQRPTLETTQTSTQTPSTQTPSTQTPSTQTPSTQTPSTQTPDASAEAAERGRRAREIAAAVFAGVTGGLAALHGNVASADEVARQFAAGQASSTTQAPKLTAQQLRLQHAASQGLVARGSAIDVVARAAHLDADGRALLAAVAAHEGDAAKELARAVAKSPVDAAALVDAFVADNARFTDLVGVPGLTRGLDAGARAMLDGLASLGSDRNALMPARALRALLLSPTWASADDAARGAAFQAVLAERTSYLATVDNAGGVGADATPPPPSRPFESALLTCGPENGAAFHLSAPMPDPHGCRVDLRFADATIALVTVDDREPAPSRAQVAAALGALPPALRHAVKRVVWNPVDSPDDAHWRSEPGFSATHRSALAARAGAGSVYIYPNLDVSPVELFGLLTHEATHLIEPQVMANDALRATWEAARAAPEFRASNYAFSSSAEDLAETVRLYGMAVGSRHEGAFRAMMPARFAALDAIFAALAQSASPSPPPSQPPEPKPLQTPTKLYGSPRRTDDIEG